MLGHQGHSQSFLDVWGTELHIINECMQLRIYKLHSYICPLSCEHLKCSLKMYAHCPTYKLPI